MTHGPHTVDPPQAGVPVLSARIALAALRVCSISTTLVSADALALVSTYVYVASAFGATGSGVTDKASVRGTLARTSVCVVARATLCAPSRQSVRDEQLCERVRTAHVASKGRYGRPRVHAELHAAGEHVSRKHIARLMKDSNLAGGKRCRVRKTTNSSHALPIAPNVVSRDFTASAPNQTWVTDITFIWMQQEWLYLAAILDLYSPRVVGWATSSTVDRHLALAALHNALRDRRPGRGLVHHSDRGSTYT